MSDLNTNIQVSRERIVRLEEHLQFEKEKLAKMLESTSAFGGDEQRMGSSEMHLKALEGVIEKKKMLIGASRAEIQFKMGGFQAVTYNQDSLNALEPIFKTLKRMDERLQALEEKN